jgi:hypothetical protein
MTSRIQGEAVGLDEYIKVGDTLNDRYTNLYWIANHLAGPAP